MPSLNPPPQTHHDPTLHVRRHRERKRCPCTISATFTSDFDEPCRSCSRPLRELRPGKRQHQCEGQTPAVPEVVCGSGVGRGFAGSTDGAERMTTTVLALACGPHGAARGPRQPSAVVGGGQAPPPLSQTPPTYATPWCPRKFPGASKNWWPRSRTLFQPCMPP